MKHFTEDRRKFEELILFVSQQCAPKRDFGVTTLNKILYYADNYAYAKLGKPITGADYMRDQHGPVPRYSAQVRAQLERNSSLRIEHHRGFREHVLERPIALRAPDLSLFTEQELAIVRDVISDHWKLSTGKARKRSHDLASWRAARLHETIPYEWIFIDEDQRITPAEIARYNALAEQHGWRANER